MQQVIVNYQAARNAINDGDLLLWHPTNIVGRIVASRTNGPYAHVGSASWAHGVLESHGQLLWQGGTTQNLSALVERWPGIIDVYDLVPTNPMFDSRRSAFAARQRRRAGYPYGWIDLMHQSEVVLHTTLLPGRGMCLQDVKYGSETWSKLFVVPVDCPAFCSQGVISDIRASGIDALSDFAAWEVTPNMIAKIATYKFTLGA